jgi:hypothetical protein
LNVFILNRLPDFVKRILSASQNVALQGPAVVIKLTTMDGDESGEGARLHYDIQEAGVKEKVHCQTKMWTLWKDKKIDSNRVLWPVDL